MSEDDWDFREFTGEKTRYLTHGLHPYPARMIPQIAERCIRKYLLEHTQADDTQSAQVLDPFCGSGTTLIEGRLAGLNVAGSDINPLAVLVSKVASTPLTDEIEIIAPLGASDFLSSLRVALKDNGRKQVDRFVPSLSNLSFWFKNYVIRDLSIVKSHIENLKAGPEKDIANVAFSLTLREASNIRRGGKYSFDTTVKKMRDAELKLHNPVVFEIFKRRLGEVSTQVRQFGNSVDQSRVTQVRQLDARQLGDFVQDSSVDLIVTSPPYGEEKNTVVYSRFTKLSNVWLFGERLTKESEASTLGFRASHKDARLSQTTENIIRKVSAVNLGRGQEVRAFVADYVLTLKEMHRILKTSAYCCIIVGDRRAANVFIPMDVLTEAEAATVGFEHHETFHRNIIGKAIPSLNIKGETITKENIIILSK